MALRSSMRSVMTDEEEYMEMVKDEHLLTTALKQDKAIFSTDDKARSMFRRVARVDSRLRDMVWGNPESGHRNCIDWLRKRTEDPSLKLG